MCYALYPGLTDLKCRWLFAVAYWFVWTRLIPGYKGYRLEEEADILGDGTTITKLVRKEI